MLNKPFKPLTIVRKPADSEPPTKRQRIDPPSDESLGASTEAKLHDVPRPSLKPAQRKPLLQVKSSVTAEQSNKADDSGNETYYNVLWRKFTTKKNKTWDGDGVLCLTGGYAHLQDISGKPMGKTICNIPLLPGSSLSVGGKDVEVESIIPKQEYLAGRPFLNTLKRPTVQELDDAIRPTLKAQMKQAKLEEKQVDKVNITAPATKVSSNQFKTPLLSTTVMPKPSNATKPQPRHDPDADGALVMKRLPQAPKGKQTVDVVVDPILCKHLREHQREGVKFMYECVMGLRAYGGEGAILADEMGLGKTLQTIALLWTLMKQNPIYGESPVVKKAMIVCPVSLMNNWKKEFRKWLGNERIGVLVADDKRTRVTDFTKGKAYSVMIIGYERLRTVQDELQKGHGIDIVVCDEGHRLKTAKNKAAAAIKSLSTERRIVLTGTPMQNDLNEFFVMTDFVNPGFLGKYNTFKREFETPILRSRQPDATAKDMEKGKAREEELASLTSQFMLRRTADVLSKYLPPKTETVLFCKPTAAQASVYRNVISSPVFNAALGSTQTALQLINVLKKVCNSPSLLRSKVDETPSDMLQALTSSIKPSVLSSSGSSSKIRVLDALLHHIRSTTSEKVIIVSNYTSTLDILGQLLTSLSYPFLRLDGSIADGRKRQNVVDRFNNSPASSCFALLLSAKAGGVGLNLIGASRLVLFDSDWNPATDLQAMARIHRDGQKMRCYIYRLLVKGALDEKIYQRQVVKLGLADAVVDGSSKTGGGGMSFSKEELRDLFSLDESEGCQTHELLGCPCQGKGKAVDSEAAPPMVEEEDEDDDELPELGSMKGLRPASEVDFERMEKEEEEKRAGKAQMRMKALWAYDHVDVGYVGELARKRDDDVEEDSTAPEDLVDDTCLLDMLLEDGCPVRYIFTRTTQ